MSHMIFIKNWIVNKVSILPKLYSSSLLSSFGVLLTSPSLEVVPVFVWISISAGLDTYIGINMLLYLENFDHLLEVINSPN